jgi:hypothetical protein
VYCLSIGRFRYVLLAEISGSAEAGVCLIISDVNVNLLVKVVSADFSAFNFFPLLLMCHF